MAKKTQQSASEKVNMLTTSENKEETTMQGYTDDQDLQAIADEFNQNPVAVADKPSTAKISKSSAKNDRQARQAKVAKENRDGKPADKPAKPVFEIDIVSDEPTVMHQAMLGDLFPLDMTGIPSAKVAMREIHKAHVADLRIAYAKPDNTIPAIRVVSSNMGLVPWDGNHRWQALSENLMADLGLDPADKASASNTQFQAAIFKTPVWVEITNYVNGHPVTNRDLIQLAFTANFEHGLPVSTYGRTSYAIWLLADAAARGEKMKQQTAADAAGVSKFALSMALGRQRDAANDKAKQPVDLTYLDEDDNRALDDVVEQLDTKAVEDKLAQAVKRFINTAKALETLFETPEDLHTYMAELVTEMKASDGIDFVFETLAYGFEREDEKEVAAAE